MKGGKLKITSPICMLCIFITVNSINFKKIDQNLKLFNKKNYLELNMVFKHHYSRSGLGLDYSLSVNIANT